MEIADILSVERVATRVQSGSKKRALEQLSQLLVNNLPAVSQVEVFESLLARERLGSTGIGHGVAIPHGRLKDGKQSIAAFIQLHDSIDFDAVDRQPVNLMFALLVPEDSTEEHLQILSQLAEMFSDEAFCEQLRQAPDSEVLHSLLTHWRRPT